MITIHARLRQTDGQTDEHHGNSATIRPNERITRAKTNPGEFDVKVVIDVTLTKYGLHCSSATKVGGAVAYSACSPCSTPLAIPYVSCPVADMVTYNI